MNVNTSPQPGQKCVFSKTCTTTGAVFPSLAETCGSVQSLVKRNKLSNTTLRSAQLGPGLLRSHGAWKRGYRHGCQPTLCLEMSRTLCAEETGCSIVVPITLEFLELQHVVIGRYWQGFCATLTPSVHARGFLCWPQLNSTWYEGKQGSNYIGHEWGTRSVIRRRYPKVIFKQ